MIAKLSRRFISYRCPALRQQSLALHARTVLTADAFLVEQDRLPFPYEWQVLYAAQRHTHVLPDGSRAGFFIGDGAGVGKVCKALSPSTLTTEQSESCSMGLDKTVVVCVQRHPCRLKVCSGDQCETNWQVRCARCPPFARRQNNNNR